MVSESFLEVLNATVNEQNRSIYEFGPFRLDARKRLLWRDGEIVTLKPKAFDTLLALVEGNGRVVEKEELMKRVWPDTVVEEGNLTFNISSLRKALGDDPRTHQYIVTIPGEGYQFVAGVRAGFDELEVRERTRVSIVEEEETNGAIARAPLAGNGSRIADNSVAESNTKKWVERDETALASSALLTTSSSLPQQQRSRRKMLIAGGLLCVLLGIGGFGYWRYKNSQPSNAHVAPIPFQQMELKRVTVSGRAKDVAISPDGRYIAYVLFEGNLQSMHLLQVGTNSSVQIRPPEEVSYDFPVFSPDGKSLYYFVSEENQARTLYRSDVLGGVAQRVLSGSLGAVAFSPDGKSLAIVRNDPRQGETALFVADADGGRERRLAVRKYPGIFTGGAGWSPDGKIISVPGTSERDRSRMKVFGVRVSDGDVEPLSTYEWPVVNRVAWLGDGSGMVLMAGRDQSQLWYLSHPGGDVRRITNDLHDYNAMTLSLSADSRSLVTVQLQTTSNIWVLPEGDPERARQITFGPVGRYDGLNGLAWTPHGKIVYSSHIGDGHAIWQMDAGGANARELTPAGQRDVWPTVTPDGRHVVFCSYRSGVSEIWRMDADGANPLQLTFDGPNYNPSVFPDGKWLVYESVRGQRWALWKISIDGGDPVQLTDKPSRRPSISPDGKLIACIYDGGIALVPAAGGTPIKTFRLPPGVTAHQVARWTPDGQALMFCDENQGVWRQPVAGGAPVHLRDFGPERIFNLAWSPDGKQLALARGTQTYDVVLIRDLRNSVPGSSR